MVSKGPKLPAVRSIARLDVSGDLGCKHCNISHKIAHPQSRRNRIAAKRMRNGPTKLGKGGPAINLSCRSTRKAKTAASTMSASQTVVLGRKLLRGSMITSNENKMIDGGRDRASLGVKTWKSS